MSAPSTIPVYRLFAAADLLLSAMASKHGPLSLIELAPDGSRKDHPDASDPFTQAELLEAMSMLTRMGYFENRRAKPLRGGV